MPEKMRYRNDGKIKVLVTVSMDTALLAVNLDRLLVALERALPYGVELCRPEICEAMHTLREGLSDLRSGRLFQSGQKEINPKFAGLLISDEDASAILKKRGCA